MATTVCLEAHYFGEDSEELRLVCDAVAANADSLLVAGVEVRHLRALKWRPDYLSYCDLRAKAADDTSDQKGDAAAVDLLGHTDIRTTKRHYLRRGKRVAPTK
ncbi:hypothetical protein D9M68_406070 [compost metagenome]